MTEGRCLMQQNEVCIYECLDESRFELGPIDYWHDSLDAPELMPVGGMRSTQFGPEQCACDRDGEPVPSVG